MLRQGRGEPLVLLHGVMCSGAVWRETIPELAEHHDTIALTALGHRSGRRPERRPAKLADVVADAEAALDGLELETAHLAGNSMGGWVALELARRGRARSVCALSPGGTAPPGPEGHAARRATVRRLNRMAADARRARAVLPLLVRSPRVRRFALRLNAERGERVAPDHLLDSVADVLGCTVRADILGTREELAPLVPAPCPVTIAWAEHDRVLPLDPYGLHARELVPGARFEVLEGLGHVPMFDDPVAVARTILQTTARAALTTA